MNLHDDLKTLKEKLLLIEKQYEVKLTEVEEKESRFKQVEDQLKNYLEEKDKIIFLNIGGKVYQTKISTILSVKDTVFYKLLTSYIEKGEEMPKELFFDRGYNHFPVILEYLRTKKFNIKEIKNRFDREEVISELTYYGMNDIMGVGKKIPIDLAWDQGRSKAGTFTINSSDSSKIQIHSTTCYTHFVTNKNFNNENFVVELEVNVQQSDNYLYIGVINEMYNTASNCMCCNPTNSYYLQCDGSIHINGVRTQDYNYAWNSQKVIIGIRAMITDKQIFFYMPDKTELGPYVISNGNNFTVVAGHCNQGNGQINILDCYAA